MFLPKPSSVFLIIGVFSLIGCNQKETDRIVLMPEQGRMMINALVPDLNGQIFGLGVPETIGSQEQMMLVNHSNAEIHWETDERTGSVSTTWARKDHLRYVLEIVPSKNYVDLVMTVENQSSSTWHDVFALNCVSPANAPSLRDSLHERTYISVEGEPVPLEKLPKVQGLRPTITVYPTKFHAERLPPFAGAFEATNPVHSDGSWVIVVSEDQESYMATATGDASFLFTNTKFGCIHAAPSFGNLAPGEARTVVSRVYLTRGSLQDFLLRYELFKKRTAIDR